MGSIFQRTYFRRRLLLIKPFPFMLCLIMLTLPCHAEEDKDRSFTWKDRSMWKNEYSATPGTFDKAMQEDLGAVDEIVFAVRGDGRDGHYYANFGYHIARPDQFKYGGVGGRLCVMNLKTREVRNLIDDPTGDVRDPAVSYDAQTILFAYRPGDQNQFHLYTIKPDGSDLTQLTSGEFDDFEPCWLPDGGIMFTSSRCMRWVPCWYTQVSLLYRCDADGSNITQIGFGVENENAPWPMQDGRVAFTRWEYVDRKQLHYHGLWSVDPDGTGVKLLFDNHGSMILHIDAKPIPGTDKLVTVLSPLHGANEHRGRIGILNPALGPENDESMDFLDRGYPLETKTKKGGRWRDPYPISKDCFLLASEHALAVMNGAGDYEFFYELPEAEREALNVHEPRALRSRKREPVIPHTPPAPDGMANVQIMDVTIGQNMKGIEKGQIKSLVVMEELPRPGANSMAPDAIGWGQGKNYILRRILGIVPVEPDGSAHFKVPAGRPIFFYALDENNLSAKVMSSFITTMSGEQVSCIGCHEERNGLPQATQTQMVTQALKRPPSNLKPIDGVPEILDYVRDIQPIWDKHCVSCHNYEKFAGELILTNDMTASWMTSFFFLKAGDNKTNLILDPPLVSTDPGYEPSPYSVGSGESRLIKVLMKGHKKVRLSDQEMERIKRWADAGSTFAGTYAALDSIGARQNINFHSASELHDKAKAVMKKRCDTCHQTAKRGKHWIEDENWRVAFRYNVTDIDKSLLLKAPLSKEAGGLGFCKQWKKTPDGAPSTPVFTTTDDPDYQILKEFAANIVEPFSQPRWFQEGHKPTSWYIREMVRFGALDESFFSDDKPIDGYAVDEAYFNILYRQGPGPKPE